MLPKYLYTSTCSTFPSFGFIFMISLSLISIIFIYPILCFILISSISSSNVNIILYSTLESSAIIIILFTDLTLIILCLPTLAPSLSHNIFLNTVCLKITIEIDNSLVSLLDPILPSLWGWSYFSVPFTYHPKQSTSFYAPLTLLKPKCSPLFSSIILKICWLSTNNILAAWNKRLLFPLDIF